tara:strand:- start:198 stop:470 length:273 start_codon:yes stop_codon:yes gene_type:complete
VEAAVVAVVVAAVIPLLLTQYTTVAAVILPVAAVVAVRAAEAARAMILYMKISPSQRIYLQKLKMALHRLMTQECREKIGLVTMSGAMLS